MRHRVWQFIKSVTHHWGVLVTGGVAIGVLGVWQGTGHVVKPWVYWLVAIVGLFVAFFKAWNDQANEKEKALAKIAERAEASAAFPIAIEWKELAKEFRQLPRRIRADWNRNRDGEESWRMFHPECEALCKLAGAMLARSPKVFPEPHPETDTLFRWLGFLKKEKNLSDIQYGIEQPEGKVVLFGSLDGVAEMSAAVCIECAAKEI
jgi:uncharacterized membrane protein